MKAWTNMWVWLSSLMSSSSSLRAWSTSDSFSMILEKPRFSGRGDAVGDGVTALLSPDLAVLVTSPIEGAL